jgi:hypothetical protein
MPPVAVVSHDYTVSKIAAHNSSSHTSSLIQSRHQVVHHLRWCTWNTEVEEVDLHTTTVQPTELHGIQQSQQTNSTALIWSEMSMMQTVLHCVNSSCYCFVANRQNSVTGDA